MIRVTVELLPCGNEEKKRHLGTAEISNDCTGDVDVGHYTVRLSKWGRPKSIWKSGVVRNFPRQIRGPWDLLYLALDATVGSRNRKAR